MPLTIITPLISLLIIGLTLFLMTRERRIMFRICLILFVLSFSGGLCIYTFSYLASGQSPYDAFYAALRGIFSTARMFFINDDRSALSAISSQGLFGIDVVYVEIILWLCHVMALIVAQTALISLFARKFNDRLRLLFGSHSEVYIIVGSDKNALTLGENIATRDNPEHKPYSDRIIVFILEQDDEAEKIQKKITHFGGILLVIDKSNNLLGCLKKVRLGCLSLSRSRKYKVVFFPSDTVISDDVRHVVEYGKEKFVKHQNLEIFALTSSEWGREEIEDISKEVEDYAGNETRKFPYTIHLLNMSDIISRQMIKRCHSPYSCLQMKNVFYEAKSSKDFTVMILGFGETGQNALLKLIRNGQFVGSRMHAIIADKEIISKHIYDRFQKSFPALKLCCEIANNNILNMDVLSKEFYDNLVQIDNSVDYIVIALSNDEDNKKAALELQRHYLRNCEIVPLIAVSSEESCFQKDSVFCFGRRDDVYTESIVIDEDLDVLAEKLNSGYNRGQFRRDITDRIEWHELDWFSQESKRAQVDFLPSMLELADLNDEQKSVLENMGGILYRIDRNKQEKRIAERQNDEKRAIEIQAEIDNDIKLKQSLMSKLSLTEALKETFAHTEHLRWNAFHVTMGYSPISIEEMWNRYERFKNLDEKKRQNLCRKDDVARLHLCLVHWNELDDYYNEYCKINPTYKDFKEMDYDGAFYNIAKYLYIQSKDI